MANSRRCECCATASEVLVDMKKEFFDSDRQTPYFAIFHKFLKLFEDENLVYGKDSRSNLIISLHFPLSGTKIPLISTFWPK
jgi:hypothetical protein